jgi:hypothetical protein
VVDDCTLESKSLIFGLNFFDTAGILPHAIDKPHSHSTSLVLTHRMQERTVARYNYKHQLFI